MASTITQLINNNFGGIRRKDAYFSDEKITCSDCQNVELFFTKLNSGVGIRTAKGNTTISAKTNKIPLTVYSYINKELDELADDGIVTGKTLIFSTTVNEEQEYHIYTRDSKKDMYASEAFYYAFSNKTNTVYTPKERNEIEYVNKAETGSKLFTGDYEIVDIYGCYQNAVLCTFVYVVYYTTVSEERTPNNGVLYLVDFDNNSKTTITDALSPSLYSCFAEMINGTQDILVFSNGNELVYSKVDTDPSSGTYGQRLEPNVYYNNTNDGHSVLRDDEGDTGNIVSGLGLVSFDKRLWIFNGRRLWYSDKLNCEKFRRPRNETVSMNSPGYIDEVKNITSIYPYLGSLAVFSKDSSILVEVDGSSIENKFKQSDESPGGCASYKAAIFHGTDLYFYDDVKKGVYSFKQIVLGDKTLGENIALDIQEELIKISSKELDKIRTLSVVTEDRNEVWFLIPIADDSKHSIVMIFDYIRGEWVKRKCQHINGINVVDGTLYSTGCEVFEEYKGTTFAGEFIEAFYTCSMFNMGADNTLKITKFPPRVTVDGNTVSNFLVKYIKNYNFVKTPKIKEVKSKNNADVLVFDTEDRYDTGKIYIPNTINSVVKIPSATFKSLEITFYITNEEQSFAIKNVEFSKIKVKQV